MAEDERLYRISRLIHDHTRSPSLAHIRDGHIILKLAQEILKSVDGPLTLWEKWGEQREALARAAAEVWVPDDDFLDALNRLPGPRLTPVDLHYRMEAIRGLYGPEDDLREGCLRAYAEEKARGTEFIAILGYLGQWMADAGTELYERRREQNQQRIAHEKAASEARLRSGADCPWTEVKSVTIGIHCRKNGRLYRLVKVEKGMVEVSQVKALDDKRGVYIGRYFTRSEATKVLNEVAYKSDWTS